ncbi:hypothetical protein WJ91_03110 [Burkholderia ubonensis]|nr:hypothetical protein WJ91_03110 [Burkholderia ubonensis]
MAEHADFAQGRDSVEVFAGHAYEPYGSDERVDLVDDDSFATAQEAADLRIVPTERCLHFVTFGAV